MSYCGNIVKYDRASQIVRDRLATNVGCGAFVATQSSIPIGNTSKNHIKLFAWVSVIDRSKNSASKSLHAFLGMLPTGILLKKQSVGDIVRRMDANELSYRYNSTLCLRTYDHMDLHVLGVAETF